MLRQRPAAVFGGFVLLKSQAILGIVHDSGRWGGIGFHIRFNLPHLTGQGIKPLRGSVAFISNSF